MKILLSAYACEPGKGSEPGVGWNWALELARQGHHVTVLTRANNVETIAPALGSMEALPLKFVYYDLPKWMRWWKKGGRGVHLYYQLWQIGIYRVARQLTRSEQFDVVHHLTFGVFRQPSWLGHLDIPFILGPLGGGEKTPDSMVSTYGLNGRIEERVRRFTNRLAVLDPVVQRMFSRASIILCRNQQTLQTVPERYRLKCKIEPEDSVEPDWIHETATATDTRCFLFVGRFIYLKGIHLAMDALAIAVKRRPELKLVLVGNGPEFNLLKRRAEKLEITRSVEWHGWMPQAELRKFYRNSIALVFPSMRDSGGTVVRESLASGTPVICLNTGGPGVIVPDDAGFKINCDGRTRDQVVADLADAMLALANDRELAARMSRNAIEFARKHTWEAAVKRAYEVVEERLNLTPASLVGESSERRTDTTPESRTAAQ